MPNLKKNTSIIEYCDPKGLLAGGQRLHWWGNMLATSGLPSSACSSGSRPGVAATSLAVGP